MKTFRVSPLFGACAISLTLLGPSLALADDAPTAAEDPNTGAQDPNAQLGAHFFVGRWDCAGKTMVPNLPAAKTIAHIQGEEHGSWTLDHFDATGAFGISTHAKGWSTWDPETKTLHRYATPFFGPSVHWVNKGGWDGNTLMLEAESKLLFGIAHVWVLDVFTKADDNRSFHHETYYAKDSKTWAPFYIADCKKTGGKTGTPQAN